MGDSNCLTRTFMSGTEYSRGSRKINLRGLTPELACGGAMLQDQTRCPRLNDRAPQVVGSIRIEMTQQVMEWSQLAGMETH